MRRRDPLSFESLETRRLLIVGDVVQTPEFLGSPLD